MKEWCVRLFRGCAALLETKTGSNLSRPRNTRHRFVSELAGMPFRRSGGRGQEVQP